MLKNISANLAFLNHWYGRFTRWWCYTGLSIHIYRRSEIKKESKLAITKMDLKKMKECARCARRNFTLIQSYKWNSYFFLPFKSFRNISYECVHVYIVMRACVSVYFFQVYSTHTVALSIFSAITTQTLIACTKMKHYDRLLHAH